jgi:hypothetical protein
VEPASQDADFGFGGLADVSVLVVDAIRPAFEMPPAFGIVDPVFYAA